MQFPARGDGVVTEEAALGLLAFLQYTVIASW